MIEAFECAVICPPPRALPLPPVIDPFSDDFSLSHAQEMARLRAQSALQLAETAAENSHLVVLPDDIHGIRHYWRRHDAPSLFRNLAQPIPCPATAQAGKMARRHGAYVVLSMYERTRKDVFGAVLLFGPCGNLVGAQHKVHPAFGEDWSVTPGEGFAVIDTELGALGLVTGDDWLLPETACVLARLGADVVVCPSKRPLPEGMLQARCQEYGFAMVLAYPAASFIIDQRGRTLAQSAGNQDFTLAAELTATGPVPSDRDALDRLLSDEESPRRARSRLRRPSAYAPLAADAWNEAPAHPARETGRIRRTAVHKFTSDDAPPPPLPEWELQ